MHCIGQDTKIDSSPFTERQRQPRHRAELRCWLAVALLSAECTQVGLCIGEDVYGSDVVVVGTRHYRFS